MDVFGELVKSLSKIRKEMLSIGRGKRIIGSAEKVIKKRSNCNRKLDIYQKKMTEYRKELMNIYDELFRAHYTRFIYTKVAEDIMRVLIYTHENTKIEEHPLLLAVGCITTPIIGQIMGVLENSRTSKQEQRSRARFIMTLLNLDLASSNSNVALSRLPEVEPRVDNRPRCVKQTHIHITSATPLILGVLFDAIEKHTKTLEGSKEDIANFLKKYYHQIMNSVLLTDIIEDYLELVAANITQDGQNHRVANLKLLTDKIPGLIQQVERCKERLAKLKNFEVFRRTLNRISYLLMRIDDYNNPTEKEMKK